MILAHPHLVYTRSKLVVEDGAIQRSWLVSLAVAAAVVGAAIVVSAVVNPLFGRYVHWDWMAGLAPTLYVIAVVALRRRWV